MKHSNEQDMMGLRGGRLAATVILVRDGAAGLEVWMQERVLTMPNYPGMTVFPGGGVDFRDFPSDKQEAAELWYGRPVEDIAMQLGVRPRQAHALTFAAVRELFEETGTLLLVDDDGKLVSDARPFHKLRRRLENHELALTEVLEETGLDVDANLVLPYGRWVGTSEKGNWFDTFSFVAVLPDGQEPDNATGEASDANWFPPNLLLDGWREGLVRFARSTLAQLYDVAQFSTAAEVVAAAHNARIEPVIGDPVKIPRYEELLRHDPVNRIGW
ncbi:NUDIX hydrolase [Corynebacterium aquatimens]|uniref:8-oxo-dGTP pyrophosphatase MutT (NUDIX family) n=1 Tax=Corynebacterium aquatimens TaxID=1190508 RepID=A0A931E035_9CORY|nr:NUDIX hydrolase [Corynebacterium aquatimens]MBG6121387.1 8-oxo-dGTP pyrophosphatase MutT (NUDIX family) [Corynebacterium aquatimens]WJY66068.1 NUDIX domain protein [Corynebacterium aquatimens]